MGFLSPKQKLTPSLLGVLFVLMPILAQANERPVHSTSMAMVQVGLGLIAVIALMFLLAWLARRMRLVPGGSHSGSMKVLAILPLGHKERIALIQVGEQQMLLGVTPEQVNLLHCFDQPVSATESASSVAFSQVLKRWSGRYPATDASESKS